VVGGGIVWVGDWMIGENLGVMEVEVAAWGFVEVMVGVMEVEVAAWGFVEVMVVEVMEVEVAW